MVGTGREASGIRFVAGTDTGIRDSYPGFSLHDELEWLCRAGLSEMEALQAATRNPAIVMDQVNSLGTVEDLLPRESLSALMAKVERSQPRGELSLRYYGTRPERSCPPSMYPRQYSPEFGS